MTNVNKVLQRQMDLITGKAASLDPMAFAVAFRLILALINPTAALQKEWVNGISERSFSRLIHSFFLVLVLSKKHTSETEFSLLS